VSRAKEDSLSGLSNRTRYILEAKTSLLNSQNSYCPTYARAELIVLHSHLITSSTSKKKLLLYKQHKFQLAKHYTKLQPAIAFFWCQGEMKLSTSVTDGHQ